MHFDSSMDEGGDYMSMWSKVDNRTKEYDYISLVS
jgi:hypothetical protein